MAPSVTLSDVRGLNSADAPTRLPAGFFADVANVLLEPLSLGRRRSSIATMTAPNSLLPVRQLARFQPAADASVAQLFACVDTPALYRYSSSSWSSVTLSDTVTEWASARPAMATLNGKLFIAYDSDVNRLHVYDPTVSTSALRRVGIAASAAATVANTGSGSYANTTRYYKIQWKLKSGSNVIATSELSASVSFTPSGSGTAARVTKPTTSDSATHWVVFGSSDNVNYYDLSGDLAVGTTTYDDSTAPSSYTGDVPPTAGLYVPPPSAKFLLATDNRLLMAGCWETTGTSSQTAPRNSRVWFTSVLGALDNTGEDEAITQTTTDKYWVDIGENDGDAIVGLAGPLDGNIYVFKSRSIWRMTPTGLSESPYRTERITSATGAIWQDGITMGADAAGNPSIYFMSPNGPQRITPGYGLEDLGADVRTFYANTFSALDNETPLVIWDYMRMIVWWINGRSGLNTYAFQPQFEERTRDGVRGGWTRHTLNFSTAALDAIYAATIYEVNSIAVPVFGGGNPNGNPDTGAMGTLSGSSRRDASTTAIAASVTSPILQPFGPLQRWSFQAPVLEWDYPGAATAITVQMSSAIGGPTTTTGSLSDATTGSTYSQSVIQETLESLQLSDVAGLQVTITWDTTVDGDERPRIHSLTIPTDAKEPA